MRSIKLPILYIITLLLASCGSMRMYMTPDSTYTKDDTIAIVNQVEDASGTLGTLQFLLQSNGYQVISYKNAKRQLKLDSIERATYSTTNKTIITKTVVVDTLKGDTTINIDHNRNIKQGSVDLVNRVSSVEDKRVGKEQTKIITDSVVVHGYIDNKELALQELAESDVAPIYSLELKYSYYLDLLYYSYTSFTATITNMKTDDVVLTASFVGDKRCPKVLESFIKQLNMMTSSNSNR